MKYTKQVLFFALMILSSSIFAQLIVDDEFTAKGMAPEGSFAFDEGSTIPNLRFKNLKSETFNLHDKIDRLTVVEFWYTTCKLCVENKKNFISKYPDQFKINLISIAVDEKASTVRKYVSDNNNFWDNIQDNSAFKGYFQKTKGVARPIYILVNTDKEIVQVFDQGNARKLGAFLQSYERK